MQYTITATKPNRKEPLYSRTVEANNKIEAYSKVRNDLKYIIKNGAELKIIEEVSQ